MPKNIITCLYRGNQDQSIGIVGGRFSTVATVVVNLQANYSRKQLAKSGGKRLQPERPAASFLLMLYKLTIPIGRLGTGLIYSSLFIIIQQASLGPCILVTAGLIGS
jgi:hypothetical protein